MKPHSVETRREALEATGHALAERWVSFAEAISLRDLARAGRTEEVVKLLNALEHKSRS